jgi:hypothetical protein
MQSINRAATPSVKKRLSELPTVGTPGGICSRSDPELLRRLWHKAICS